MGTKVKLAAIPQDIFQEIANVLGQLPFGQIAPLIQKLNANIRYIEEDAVEATAELNGDDNGGAGSE